MDFLILKDKFIANNPDYSNDVANFMNYMQNVYGLDLPSQQDLLVSGMRTERIIESLKYYVEIGQIKKQEPAKKYFVSIGQLFEFILSNSEYLNDNLKKELANPSSREDSYSRKTNAFVTNNENLQQKEILTVLDNEKITSLIGWCDDALEKDFERSATINSTQYKRLSASLCMKLMLLTGITYRVARKLELSNLNVAESTIMINGFTIRLPKKLSVQFKSYYELRSRLEFRECIYLFSNFDGQQWGDATTTSGIPAFMSTAINETTITGIIKYGITQLIKSGINDSVVIRITGASREILKDCIDEIQNTDIEWESYVNSRIVNTDKYYYL